MFTDLDILRLLVGGDEYRRVPGDDDAVEKKTAEGIVEVEAWMADPIMWEHIAGGGDGGAIEGAAHNRGFSGFSLKDPDFESDSEDESMDEMASMEALWAKRHELAGAAEHEIGFDYTVRGGKWTAKHVGVLYDSYRAEARTPGAKNFCKLYNIPKSATFSVKKYKEDWCVILCKLWTSRMSHVYGIFTTHESIEKYKFERADSDAYVLPINLLEGGGAMTREVRARVRQVRDLAPK